MKNIHMEDNGRLKAFIPATVACTVHEYHFIAPIMSLPKPGRPVTSFIGLL